jgi:hypothetical protein
MLGKNNVVYVYRGQLLPDASNLHTTTFKAVRDTIIQMKKDVINAHVHDAGCAKIQEEARVGNPNVKPPILPDPNWKNACLDKDLVIVIKPDEEATYKNTIDILDEMAISAIKRYAMVDLFPVEKDLIKKIESGN